MCWGAIAAAVSGKPWNASGKYIKERLGPKVEEGGGGTKDERLGVKEIRVKTAAHAFKRAFARCRSCN